MLQQYVGGATVHCTYHAESKHITEVRPCNGLWTSVRVETLKLGVRAGEVGPCVSCTAPQVWTITGSFTVPAFVGLKHE